jgi:hypothetical protein
MSTRSPWYQFHVALVQCPEPIESASATNDTYILRWEGFPYYVEVKERVYLFYMFVKGWFCVPISVVGFSVLSYDVCSCITGGRRTPYVSIERDE